MLWVVGWVGSSLHVSSTVTTASFFSVLVYFPFSMTPLPSLNNESWKIEAKRSEKIEAKRSETVSGSLSFASQRKKQEAKIGQRSSYYCKYTIHSVQSVLHRKEKIYSTSCSSKMLQQWYKNKVNCNATLTLKKIPTFVLKYLYYRRDFDIKFYYFKQYKALNISIFKAILFNVHDKDSIRYYNYMHVLSTWIGLHISLNVIHKICMHRWASLF